MERDGELIARLPYVKRQRYGFRLLTMPPLTQTLGPWLAPYQGKAANKLSYEQKLIEALLDQLPETDYFLQAFHHSITNWLPLYWRGYTQTTRYTYVLPDLTDLDRCWSEMRENARRNIRKAMKQVEVHDELPLVDFLRLNTLTFQRQGKQLPYSPDVVEAIDTACAGQGRRRIFCAVDTQGRQHAAAYLIWDDQAAYYLLGGTDPELVNSGAMNLVIWEAIKYAAAVTRSFDFEGSMIAPIERFFRSFGAIQQPYFQIQQVKSWPLRMALDIKGWFDKPVSVSAAVDE
ncbi:MAG: GNAT family N-acetyltransferase [Anaerolineales bacterium]|nr:GNAT family N-acetyltransferase [Anaerolineales bacterium]